MRAVIIEVNLGLLGELMSLPLGVAIDRVEQPLNQPGVVKMVLRGDGLPEMFSVAPGGVIRDADPMVRSSNDPDGDVGWEWVCHE